MSHTRLTPVREENKPADDRYITPPWVPRWVLRTFDPQKNNSPSPTF